jgi:hypothetical protein
VRAAPGRRALEGRVYRPCAARVGEDPREGGGAGCRRTQEVLLPYELIWESRCLVRRYHGHVTGAELISSLREVSSDPRADEVRACVADYSAVDALTVGEDEAALILALQIGARYSNPSLTTAGVATDAHLIAEMKRLIGLFQPDTFVHFHPTVGEALRWIRVHGRIETDCA